MNYTEVLNFWFNELTEEDRFKKDPELDQLIRDRFLSYYEAAINNELYEWRRAPDSALAEIIILDQFSRNMFRDTPQAFSSDPLALALSQFAIEKGFDKQLSTDQKAFLYMPYMHSESKIIHEIAVTLFSQKGLELNLDYEIAHKKIIDRFGRYPHRNQILDRKSTDEEIEFLKGPGSGF
jgi:uncharacterized protein (DUF924 family)